MNPILLEFLSSVARFLLAAAFGVLVKHGVIEGTEVGRYVDAASSWFIVTGVMVAPLIWAFFKAKMGDRMVKIAIKAPDDTTPAEVRAMAKLPDPAPK